MRGEGKSQTDIGNGNVKVKRRKGKKETNKWRKKKMKRLPQQKDKTKN